MKINIKSVGKPWRPSDNPNADPLWTILIENQSEPAKTYDPELTTIGWHEAEAFKSKTGKEYWRTPKTAQNAPTQAYKPKDDAAIVAMWAIKAAIQYLGNEANITGAKNTSVNFYTEVQETALALIRMVDTVKLGEPEISIKREADFVKINPVDDNQVPIENYE